METTKSLGKGLVQNIVVTGFLDEFVASPPVFRVSCGEPQLGNGADVLQDCVEIIGKYGEFDPEKFKAANYLFKDLYQIFSGSIDISIGRESGPVIYITVDAMDRRDASRFMKSTVTEYTVAEIEKLKFEFREFKKICRKLAKALSAQECHFYKQGPKKICRIWWD